MLSGMLSFGLSAGILFQNRMLNETRLAKIRRNKPVAKSFIVVFIANEFIISI